MKTNGYRTSHRNRWHLLAENILSRDELLLFEFYLDQMDFDKKHKDSYGCFEYNLLFISGLFGYKINETNNSIRSKHNKLLKLGFIHPTDKKNLFRIHNPERYIAQTKKWDGKASDYRKNEMNQPIESIIQNIASNIQINETNFQSFEKNVRNLLKVDTPRTLGSSKVKSNSYTKKEESLTKRKTFTKEQWNIKRSNNSGLPSWENKLLIDEAIKESLPINNDYKYNTN